MILTSLRRASPPSSNLEKAFPKVPRQVGLVGGRLSVIQEEFTTHCHNETVLKTGEPIVAKQAESVSAQESLAFTIKSVQTWRAVLRRAVAWKTARYTKGDIEATVVVVADADGTVGYGYMPS